MRQRRIDEEFVTWAEEMSAATRPSWWKWRARQVWRRRQQPADYIEALRTALVGETEPMQKIGWQVEE